MSLVLKTWKTANRLPVGGGRVFSLAMSLRVPYFGTILPHVVELRPGYCQVKIGDHWFVHNHIGTVHAIAQCNAAELAMGMAVDTAVPASHRWIPIGMDVQYRAKARGTLTATASFDPPAWPDEITDYTVDVDITDASGTTTAFAKITVRVEPKPAR